MLNIDKLKKILKEKNVKALKKCIQNNEITDEMYRMMFVSDYRNPPKIRYVCDFLRDYYNDGIEDKNTIEILDILLKNVPIRYLSSNLHFCNHNIYRRNLQHLVDSSLLMFVSYPFVQFTLLYHPGMLAKRLLKAISKSGRSDIIVEKNFIEEVRKYHERKGVIFSIDSHPLFTDATEETIKNCCIAIKSGDYILAPYKFKNVVSDKTIEEFKNLPVELAKDFIMLNPARINILEEVKSILESIKDKIKSANLNEIRKVNYMLSHIVREYWSYDLKDIAHVISNAQADICLPSDAIDSISNTLNYVKLEDSSLVNVMKCGIK